MPEHIGIARTELAKAESILKDAESQLKEISRTLEERWNERKEIESHMKAAASNGQMGNLLEMQARSVNLDRSIKDLGRNGAQCLKRIHAAKHYVSAINDRLDHLKREAEKLNARITNRTQSLSAPLKLSRVKLRIDAMGGKKS